MASALTKDQVLHYLPCQVKFYSVFTPFSGGSRNLERPNIERPVFRKFETSNIEITKVELFDFLYFFKLQFFEKLLLFEIEQFQKFDVFRN